MKAKAFIIFLLFHLLLFVLSVNAYASNRTFNILILHSYSMDYRWTEGLHQGIVDTLKDTSPSSLFRVEFMDTKNFYSEPFFEILADLLATKYSAVSFDGIVVTDNNALEFITGPGKDIFPGVPVVACGINNAQPPDSTSNVISVVAEESDHSGTIKQALAYRPESTKLYVLHDASATGQHIANEVRQSLAPIQHRIQVEFIADKSFGELKRFVSEREETELAYLLPFFRDTLGNVFAEGQVARALSAESSIPILASWSYQLGTGVIGGRCISPHQMGELAIHTLLGHLEGGTVPRFLTAISVYENIYDYQGVKKFNISRHLLPEQTIFINKPPTFYELHRDVLLPAVVIIAILSVITALLFLNLQKQRTINITNKNLLELDEELISTQQELVSILGEVIEARSQETGNHVKRVAKISRLLGEKSGLDNHELTILEAASPMHDVGKVGIPENILHKPGKLTEKEFNVIKTHTQIGKEILGSSDRELLRIARIIAHQHHERWDGTGYPDGLSGEDISIYARITMLADIYDALSHHRSYKRAWSEEEVYRFIRSEQGKFFDPQLVDVFFENLSEVKEIQERYR